jgi:hypothetical protein
MGVMAGAVLQTMNTKIITRLALALTVLAGLALSAQATPTVSGSLVLNELSSTTLTYVWTGPTYSQSGTVIATTPDYWQFGIADDIVTGLGGTQNINVNWVEPDPGDSNLVNWVNFFQYGPAANGSTVTVYSDYLPNPDYTYPTLTNGQTYTFNYADQYTATYNDYGDTSVPEGGATIAMLGIGLLGLALVSRKLTLPGDARHHG